MVIFGNLIEDKITKPAILLLEVMEGMLMSQSRLRIIGIHVLCN